MDFWGCLWNRRCGKGPLDKLVFVAVVVVVGSGAVWGMGGWQGFGGSGRVWV